MSQQSAMMLTQLHVMREQLADARKAARESDDAAKRQLSTWDKVADANRRQVGVAERQAIALGSQADSVRRQVDAMNSQATSMKALADANRVMAEIGRASCRERV